MTAPRQPAGKPAVHERLRRLLFLVPFVSKNPGISVDALAAQLGVGREALLQELDLLTLVGRPPFQPDDYIDIYVEDDRVYVDLDQRLSSPPRLTAAEAAALAAAAEPLRPAASAALESALGKLEKVIPPGAKDRFRDLHRKIDAGPAAPLELAPLVQAVAQNRVLAFDYFSPERGTSSPRTVRPQELFSHRGQWYLFAHDEDRGEERLFRVDRIQRPAPTGRTFAPPPDRESAPSRIPNPAARADVRVRFSKVAAPYVRERFGEDARPAPEGAVDVRVSGESRRWLTQWVLSFGGEAWVLEPEWAREAVARAAQGSLES